ncbi:uncharacterized protein LOC111266173 [Varroa jacobsoni]|nr:uncharacterized protein LOC111266173 [Varroa jacobsoni]
MAGLKATYSSSSDSQSQVDEHTEKYGTTNLNIQAMDALTTELQSSRQLLQDLLENAATMVNDATAKKTLPSSVQTQLEGPVVADMVKKKEEYRRLTAEVHDLRNRLIVTKPELG